MGWMGWMDWKNGRTEKNKPGGQQKVKKVSSSLFVTFRSEVIVIPPCLGLQLTTRESSPCPPRCSAHHGASGPPLPPPLCLLLPPRMLLRRLNAFVCLRHRCMDSFVIWAIFGLRRCRVVAADAEEGGFAGVPDTSKEAEDSS